MIRPFKELKELAVEGYLGSEAHGVLKGVFARDRAKVPLYGQVVRAVKKWVGEMEGADRKLEHPKVIFLTPMHLIELQRYPELWKKVVSREIEEVEDAKGSDDKDKKITWIMGKIDGVIEWPPSFFGPEA